MKEEKARTVSEIGPNLLEPPHILPFLMELLAGDRPPDLSQQDQLLAHLLTCHYCRTAVIFLLKVAQEYDHINNNSDKPVRDLLAQFEIMSREAEAREARDFERLAAYAEAIVKEGRETAKQSFPDVVAHLRICLDCYSIVEETVASLTVPGENP